MAVTTVTAVMTERAPKDARQRAEALDIGRSFIVRAPAGSGKTALLIRRYLKLLAKVDRPEEILAMTFTRKAAGEMRLKVLEALRDAEQGGAAKDRHEEQLLQFARAALARGREKNWRLLENTSRLQFHTIDGFGAQLVRRMPRASGFGAPPAVDDFPRAAYRKAAGQTLAALESRKDIAGSVRLLLRHLANDHDKLRGLISDALAYRDQWQSLVDIGDDPGARARLEKACRRMINQTLEKARESFPRNEMQNIADGAAHAAGNLTEPSPLRACLGMKTFPAAEAAFLEQWRGIAGLLLTREDKPRQTVNKKQGFPADNRPAKEHMLALLETLGADAPHWAPLLADARKLPAPQYDDAQWRVLVAMLRVLKRAAEDLESLFAARGICDFIEIARRARDSLGKPDEPSDFALALDYGIRHILVDEFQDTSHAQVALLELLTAGWDASDSRTLFLVGDPQQSVYLFRNADVGIYLRADKDGEIAQVRLEKITLRANFRSDPKLVEWFNKILSVGMPQQADPLLGAVKYSGAEAERESHSDAGVTIHAPPDRNAEAAAVADAVCKERAAEPDASIAILARNRSHLPEILRRLRAENVPCREVKLEPLARRPVVQDLLALTRALLHPADRAAWLALLRAPWCGLQLADLGMVTAGAKTVLENLRDQTVLDKMPPEARRRLARLTAVVEDALARRGRLPVARWVENAWRALGGAALVDAQNYDYARDFLMQLDAACAPTGLRDYGELRERVDGLYAGPRTGDGDGGAAKAGEVQVMTMHGAKGLQFDVVLIPGLASSSRSEPHRALLWSRQRVIGDGDGEHVLLAPPAAALKESDPMYVFMRGFYARKMELEQARLLYVACTRARRKLHLFASPAVNKKGEAKAPSGSLLACIWKAVGDNFTALALKQAGGPGEGEAAAETTAAPALARLPVDWRLPAGPGAIPLAPVPQADAVAPAPVFEWAGATARATGTLVHRILCRIAEEGAEKWDEARVRRCCALFQPQLHGLGMNEKDAAHVVDRAQAALLFTLGDERGRWIVDRAHGDARSEYALSGMVDGRAKSVIIDRTFTDAADVRWIIDYKTGEHRGGALEKFLDSEQERYAPQLETYAELIKRLPGNEQRAVRLGLYFPLARAWREWSPQ